MVNTVLAVQASICFSLEWSIYISILSLGSSFFTLIWVCFSVKVPARLMGSVKNQAETHTAESKSAPSWTSLRQGSKSEKGWFVANNNNAIINNKWISVSFFTDAPIDEHGDCFKENLQKVIDRLDDWDCK
ncbi:uncharacterized protein LOC111301076 [Durio zibethinus]|uniref:Uncharacterized protein LOC111301076 n=1 Tax=Durio zibethinus TaxID=66656 RepID=A0A6P5ZHV2_DURZI|nr:uncharacterized protein LOC111301076 [Durio zibethinus]